MGIILDSYYEYYFYRNLFIAVKNNYNHNKFANEGEHINALLQNSDRFRRIYSEYDMMTEELWVLENSDCPCVTDEFLNVIREQTSYLEDEISDWLIDNHHQE